MSLQECLNDYLVSKINEIKSKYDWNFNVKNLPLPYEKKSSNHYENSLDLRSFIHREIKSNSSESRALQFWYVRDWGGVKRNSEATLDNYIQSSSDDLIARREKGIASWSKILSVRDPSSYAIYDARVAMSLNSLLLFKEMGSNIFFPQLPSRNKKIVAAQAKVKTLVKYRGLQTQKSFYQFYLNLLRHSSMQCGNQFDIQTAEMILFANAENLAMRWLN